MDKIFFLSATLSYDLTFQHNTYQNINSHIYTKLITQFQFWIIKTRPIKQIIFTEAG